MKLTRRKLIKLIHEQVSSQNRSTIKRYFYSNDPYTEFRDVNQPSDRPSAKPRGLWYACGDDWREWVKTEMPHWYESYEHLYEIKVNPANILFISSPEQFKMFEAEYGSPGRWDETNINWVRVASRYAGIEICPYQYSFRNKSDWYYPWDVASGCVWHGEGIVSVTEVPFNFDMHDQESYSGDDL